MDIADFLAPENVFIDVRAIDKGKLLRDLANRAAKALDLPADDILAAIEATEPPPESEAAECELAAKAR